MSRSNLVAAVGTEVAKSAVRMGHLFSLAFPSGTLYLTDFGVPVTYNSNSYLPTTILNWQGFTETTGAKAARTEFSLALTDAMSTRISADAWQGALVNVFIAFFTERNAIVGTPFRIAGNLRMSSSVVRLGESEQAVALSCESRAIYGERDSATLISNASQQARYTGDTAFADLATTATKTIEWGGEIVKSSAPASSGPTVAVRNPRQPVRAR